MAGGVRRVLVVRTGVANTASVRTALNRLGVELEVSEERARVEDATHLVLPGVGAFGAGMSRLDQLGLTSILKERIRANRPTLCICLGLQLLFQTSQESPGVLGLSVFPETVERFDSKVRVPQIGWNQIEAEPGTRWLRSGFVYFANSYAVSRAPAGTVGAFADHGRRFLAAFERGSLLACQFHPELSGAFGQDLLARWLEASG